MSIRSALALVLLATPAGAAPLCHDLRGLYTPCPPGTPKAAPRHKAKAEMQTTRPEEAKSAPEGRTTPAAATPADPPPVATKKARPPLITQGRKLCRDTKGLYTPCPH